MKTNTLVVAPMAFALGVATFTLALLTLFQPAQPVFGQEEPAAVEIIEATDDTTEAEAADESVDTDTTDEQATAPEFKFVAKECDALTYMVRKSITLFDDANDSVSLSQEAIIYAETNIVQDIGPRLLEVGEEVVVDSSLVEKYATSSSELTDAQVAAWGQYTDNVDFELADMTPTNDVEDAVKTSDQRQADAEAAISDGLSEAESVSSDNDDDASPIWWVAGGGAVAGLWYLLYRRNEE